MNKALVRMMIGFRRFRHKYFLQDESEDSFYRKLAVSGQTPKTLLIGCSDSRVDPAILTDASPGELFVVRNVANLIPPCEPSAIGFHGTSSALEFAVGTLNVENIVVLGHRQCGGIRALMTGATDKKNSFIGQWMRIAEEVRHKVLHSHADSDLDTQCRAAEMESIKVSIKNLQSFPFIQEAIEARRLNLVGVYFDLELGQLWELDEATQNFRQLEI